jgi:cytidylate kinase
MENLLREYLEKPLLESAETSSAIKKPVVTISREFGCPSKRIAQELTETLNRLHNDVKGPRWRFISKEIVERAAKELDMKPTDIQFMLSSGEKGLLQDVLASFSNAYISNHRIKTTIRKIMLDIADAGNAVIVGRGGVGVLNDHPLSLHVRLQAPVEWRIQEICKLREVSVDEALKLAVETDKKRKSLIELVSGKPFDLNMFHVILNCSTLTRDEIIHTIINLMIRKNMI